MQAQEILREIKKESRYALFLSKEDIYYSIVEFEKNCFNNAELIRKYEKVMGDILDGETSPSRASYQQLGYDIFDKDLYYYRCIITEDTKDKIKKLMNKMLLLLTPNQSSRFLTEMNKIFYLLSVEKTSLGEKSNWHYQTKEYNNFCKSQEKKLKLLELVIENIENIL